MTTLITGGGSLTGLALADLLHESGRKVIFASRSGRRIPPQFPSVKFDWADPSTFNNPFEAPGNDIKYVYLLLPDDLLDPLATVKPFIELAVTKGVKRFILLSAAGPETDAGPDAMWHGKVHTYLHEKGLDYVAVRPTWFTENIIRFFGEGIKKRDAIESVVPTGRISFVAAQDVAQTAFEGIVNPEKFPTRDPIVLGPEILSYDDIAAILTEVLGRAITHRIVSNEAFLERYRNTFPELPEEYAQGVIAIEKKVEEGSEEALRQNKKVVLGTLSVKAWAERNKAALASSL